MRQGERGPGPLVAFVGALLQADLACRHHRDLRHGEDPVGEDEQENDQEFGGDGHIVSLP